MEHEPRTLESLVMFNNCYAGKRVLVTGHTGFKGSWLSLWLKTLGARVFGISLPPPTEPNLFEVLGPSVCEREFIIDIREAGKLADAVKEARPDLVFHLAAQPLVRLSYAEPLRTVETNVTGTANLLEAIRTVALGCAVVVVTSDKCYENREWEYAYRENDRLGGHDVYSMSKASAELVASAWYRSFFLPNPELGPLATARAGNVIGGGDYAVDRIVPDCVRSLMAGQPVKVRNPAAVRPWQHVFECLGGYLWLGARLSTDGKTSRLAGAFNFGPGAASRQPVRRLVQEVLKHWPGSYVEEPAAHAPHEATLLALSVEKASVTLGWHPVWNFEEAVEATVAWYRERHSNSRANMAAFSIAQINSYVEAARNTGAQWARSS